MIEHKNVLISLDVIEKEFVCNISKCKGACCIEGDLGAPLEDDELEILEKIYPQVEPYLMEEGKKAIQQQGVYIKDWEDDFSTTTIDEKECAYAFYDFEQNLKCGIEQAYLDKKIDFRTEPNYRSEIQFNLHEGTKVNIIDELDDWVLVELSNGASGWMELKSIKKIN